MLRSSVAAATLLVLAVGCPSAAAHVKTTAGNWLFTGETYNTDQDRGTSPNRAHRSDPVTVVWRGPAGTSATVRRALDHTEEHWRERRIPSVYPRGRFMRPRTNPFCTDPQFVFFRRGDAPNIGGWAQSRAYMSTNHTCGNQYHIRMFSDFLHGQFFPGAEHQHEFVLAPIHHERARFNVDFHCCPGVPIVTVRHRIDLPWDGARRVYLHALKPHCREFDWEFNSDASTEYGDHPNSGIVSRISFRHASEGCD
jgi:hypothetical protein